MMDTTVAPDDHSLLSRFARGRDGAAFAALVERHAGWVYGACLRACGDRAVAEDATQECFLELARQAGRVRSSLPGWLLVVARRTATRLRPRSTARIDEIAEPPAPEPDDAHERLDAALAAMPDEARALLIARYVEGLDQRELAERFGVSQPTVSRRLDQALDALRRRIDGDDARWAGALASLAVAAPASLVRKLPATVERAVALAPSGAAAGAALGGALAVAAFALVAAVALSQRAPRPTPAAAVADASPAVEQPSPLAAPITIAARSWPLADVVALIREQLPAGATVAMVPDDDGQRVDLLQDGVPAGVALDTLAGVVGWRARRSRDAIVLDHPLAAAARAALVADLHATGDARLVAAKRLAMSGDLDAALDALRAFADDAEAPRTLRDAVLSGLASLGASDLPWVPAASPLTAWSSDPGSVAIVARAWRRCVDGGLGVTPFLCHLAGVAGARAVEDDLLRLVEDARPFTPAVVGDGRFAQLYRTRCRQAAIVALGRLGSPRGLARIVAMAQEPAQGGVVAACLSAVAVAGDARGLALVRAIDPARKPWPLVAAWASAYAAVAADDYARTLAAAAGAEGSDPWNGCWDAAIARPVAAALPVLLRAPADRFADRWWMALALRRACATREPTVMAALQEAYARRTAPVERAPVAAALAALGDDDALAWLIDATERDLVPWHRIDGLATFAALRTRSASATRRLTELRDRVERGEVHVASLPLLLPVRRAETIAAIVAAAPAMDAMAQAGIARFLALAAPDVAAAHADIVALDCDQRLLGDAKLRAALAAQAAARSWPEIDAGALVDFDDTVDAAVDRLAALPSAHATAELAHRLGPFYGTESKPGRVAGPQLRVLAAWARGAPDAQVRAAAIDELGWWACVLGGRREAEAIDGLAACVRGETDPLPRQHLDARIAELRGRYGAAGDYEIIEEGVVLAGAFDDPAVFPQLDAAERALAAAQAPADEPAREPDGF